MPYTFEASTYQASSLKCLIEAIKELLSDVCVEIDEHGIKILAMNSYHIVLVDLELEASKFDRYHCDKKIVIGLNMLYFYKLIKTTNSSDILTLFMEEGEENYLGIRIENLEKNSRTTYHMSLYDLDNEKLNMDPETFSTVIILPSADFQKICRDMSNLSELVEISNVGNTLCFKCQGEFSKIETVLTNSVDGAYKIENSNQKEIVQGEFHLKYLALFTKCTNLCSTVQIYLKNDFPICLKYSVASLGTIKLCLMANKRD